MNLKLIHFEHALPAMAEMGLEHILPSVFRAFIATASALKDETLAEIAIALKDEDKALAASLIAGVLKSSLFQTFAALDDETLGKLFTAFAKSANARAVRRLTAIIRASDDDLEAWEGDATKEVEAMKAAAKLEIGQVFKDLSGFFPLSDLSPKPFPVSSESAETEGPGLDQNLEPLSADS